MADGGAAACAPIPVPAGAHRSDSRAAHPHGGRTKEHESWQPCMACSGAAVCLGGWSC